MKILGIDTETTGLTPSDNRIIEIGAVLWDWNTGTPLRMLSQFVIPEMPIPEEITKLTGITEEMIEQYGVLEEDVLRELSGLICDADYLMAHKAEFDMGFIDQAFTRRGMTAPGKICLCSLEDIKYPPEIKTRNLRHLAAEYGFLNPFAHRAIFDVLTMLKLAEQFNLEDIIARSQEPTVYVQAIVSFDEKELAKERGYHWCGAKKMWWRSWKQNDYEADKAECGFRTVILQGPPE